ncbi:MAG: aminoacyl-tRNA hydrolase [Patescibacteria group bacterium]|nr:aminoacyl-tRNA hydrolase [Patescibacteria group bacterium]
MENINFILVGLGNPGKQYIHTRHNAGFYAIEKITASFAKDNLEIETKLETKKEVESCLFNIGKTKLLALKPLGYMNKSGETLKKYLAYKNISPEEFIKKAILICDDSDLSEGRLKLTKNHGTGGHKGLASIFSVFNTTEFIRIKIGIRPLHNKKLAETFVLSSFEQNGKLDKTIQEIPEIISCLTKKGLDACQSLYNFSDNSPKTTHEP